MIWLVLQTLVSHRRRAPLQLFALVAGLALATALWSGVQAINAEARASYDRAANTIGLAGLETLVAPDGAAIPMETFVALRRAGWLVSPLVDLEVGGVRLIGVDPLTLPVRTLPDDADPGANFGAIMDGAGAVWGDPEDAAKVADAIEPRPIVIPADHVARGQIFTSLRVAQRVAGNGDVVSALIVAPDQPIGQTPLSSVAPMLERRGGGAAADVSRLTDSFHLNLTAFGFLSFAVGLFIVNGAVGLAFEQRRGLVRTLRALGVPLRILIAALAVELLALGLVSGAVGVSLGYVLAGALLPDVAATLRGLYGADVDGTLSLRPIWWLSGLGIALLGTGAASFAALWALARMPILAAARPRAWAMASGRRRLWQSGAAGLLLALAGLAYLFGQGLVAGFAVLACLLIGAALMLPILLDFLLFFAERRAKPGLSQWFWADTRQQVPRLSLALTALLLAMAANVGVATMVSSFRLTFSGFLDQRLSSELYVQLPAEIDAATFEAFAAENARAVLPIIWVDRSIAGQPTEVYGARDEATYRENWLLLDTVPDPWDRLAAGDGALVSEQLARRAELSVGDMIEIASDRLLPIVGIHSDYGNPIGQVIIGEALFRATWPDEVPSRFGLRMPHGDVPGFIAEAESKFGLTGDAFVDQASIKAISLAVFDRTFLVTDALNVLTLAVAGFAILMSLLTLSALRVPQLAPVWALGLTRAALGRIELGRAVLLAGITSVFALPLGLALSWVLLAVVNVEAFGWRLPMFLFPVDYARLLGLALIASVLAALWPALRLSRLRPADLLRVFSVER